LAAEDSSHELFAQMLYYPSAPPLPKPSPTQTARTSTSPPLAAQDPRKHIAELVYNINISLYLHSLADLEYLDSELKVLQQRVQEFKV
jgi:hypothetical protein